MTMHAGDLGRELIQFFDAKMESAYPSIPWREPIHISVTNGIDGWGCRLCIARRGFKAAEAKRLLFQTLLEFQAHRHAVHE
jgi:hypothetical protein